MSILIRGMEMPKTCSDCELYQYGFCMVTKKVCDKAWTQRQDDCPLIEVKSPHGRLIDADAMCNDLATVDIQYAQMIDWCISVTEAQPTIIEAEGSEDEDNNV